MRSLFLTALRPQTSLFVQAPSAPNVFCCSTLPTRIFRSACITLLNNCCRKNRCRVTRFHCCTQSSDGLSCVWSCGLSRWRIRNSSCSRSHLCCGKGLARCTHRRTVSFTVYKAVCWFLMGTVFILSCKLVAFFDLLLVAFFLFLFFPLFCFFPFCTLYISLHFSLKTLQSQTK